MAFVPTSVPVKQSDWPTLGDMIASGRRVVVFLDAGADTTQVNFILPEFQMVRILYLIARMITLFTSAKHMVANRFGKPPLASRILLSPVR